MSFTVVKIPYTQSSYTLNETEGYVEICVEAKSLGTSKEFYMDAITTENDMISKFALTWKQYKLTSTSMFDIYYLPSII